MGIMFFTTNGLRQLARDIMPPLLVEKIRYLKRASGLFGAPDWEYLPEGWERKDPKITGWNVEPVLKAQLERWPEFVKMVQGSRPLGVMHESPVLDNGNYTAHNNFMSYAYVLARAAHGKEKISILDWGSGVGHYYVVTKNLYPEFATVQKKSSRRRRRLTLW
jgi:hypothetical protein